jgi:hypothetical protein
LTQQKITFTVSDKKEVIPTHTMQRKVPYDRFSDDQGKPSSNCQPNKHQPPHTPSQPVPAAKFTETSECRQYTTDDTTLSNENSRSGAQLTTHITKRHEQNTNQNTNHIFRENTHTTQQYHTLTTTDTPFDQTTPSKTPHQPSSLRDKQNTYTQSNLTPEEDNHPIGDLLPIDKTHDTIRIYFQNANGISKNSWMDWSHASTLAQSMHIDVIGIAETNVLWTEPRRQYAKSFLKKTIKQANMATCSSTEVGCGEYLPGGIASCVVGNLTGHIIATIKDTSGLGRWAGHIIAGKNNKHLVIITAYRPVKAPGFLTTYQQQWRLLRQQDDPNPNPRQQILTDLEQHVAKWTS